MRLILFIYIVAFFIFSTWVVTSGFWDKDPLWRIATDGVLFLLTLLGVLFYAFSFRSNELVGAWKVISVVAILGQLGVNLYDRKTILSGKDSSFDADRISSQAVLATDLVTLLMILPGLVLNVLYAYF